MAQDEPKENSRPETPAEDAAQNGGESAEIRQAGFFRRWIGRPLFRILRVGVLVLVLTVGLVYAFFRFNREEVDMVFSHLVQSQADRLFAVELSFSRLETSGIRIFTFYDLQLRDPFDPDSLFLDCERVEVAIHPLQVVGRGGVNLSSVAIHNGRVRIHRQLADSGKANIERLFRQGDDEPEPEEERDDDGTSVRIGGMLLSGVQVDLYDLGDRPIHNRVDHLAGRFTRIAGENVIEVDTMRVATDYWGSGLVDVSGIFTIADKILTMRNARVIKGETDLTGDGFVDFNVDRYEYSILPGTLDLNHLPPALELEDELEGVARVSAQLGGTFDSTSAGADIELESGDLFGYAIENLACRLDYAAGRLEFNQISCEAWGGRLLTADTEFLFGEAGEGWSVEADVRDIVLRRLDFLPMENVRGRLSGRYHVRGQGFDPDRMTLSGRALSAWGELEGFRIDSAGAEFDYSAGGLRIDQLDLYSGPTALSAIGDVAADSMFLFLTADRFPMPRAERYLPLDSLTGSADFSGTLTGRPGDPSFNGTFTVTDGSYRQLLFESLEGDCRLAHVPDSVSGQLSLDLHRLRYGELTMDSLLIDGTIPEPGAIEFHPLLLAVDSSRVLTAAGSYSAPPEDRTDTVHLRLDSLHVMFHGQHVSSLGPMDLFYAADTVWFPDGKFSVLGGSVTGAAAFSGADWMSLQADLAGIDLRELPALAEDQPAIEGRLSGRIDIAGRPLRPQGTLVAGVDSLRLALLRLDSLHVSARFEGERIAIDSLLLVAPDSAVSVITGELPLNPADTAEDSLTWMKSPLRLHAELHNLPLSAFRSTMIPLTSGRLNGEVDVSGTGEAPRLDGALRVSGGAGVIAPINLRLQQVSGLVRLEQGRVVLDSLSSVSPEGRLSVTGSMSMRGILPDTLQLKITGRELILQQFRYVTTLRVNADLTASGPAADPLVEGRVHVLQGEVNPTFGTPVGGDEAAATTRQEVRLPPSPVNYEVRFTAEDEFWLRNRNANIKLNADLTAVQRDSLPRISGSINAVAGSYSVYGRRFRIRYGSIRFQGETTLNPRLDIQAERTVRGQVLRTDLIGGSFVSRGATGPSIPGEQYEMDRNTFVLNIGGTLNTPQFDISVLDAEGRAIDPPLTEQQARTLVILDQTWREFQQQSTYSQSKLLDQAANMALNQANPYLQEWTGLDELTFESQLFNPATAGGNGDQSDGGAERSARVTVGEFLFENVFFSISQDIIDPSARSAQIEYLIDRNSSIISQTDSRGHFSLDYRYRIRY